MEFTKLTGQQAADRIGISRATLYKWMENDLAPVRRQFGGKLWFTAEDIDEWKEKFWGKVRTRLEKGGHHEERKGKLVRRGAEPKRTRKVAKRTRKGRAK